MAIKRVVVEKMKKLEVRKPASLEQAEKFLKDSIRLQQKKIAGLFVEFDENDPDHNTLTVLDHQSRKCKSVPISCVAAMVNNWVIID